MIDRKAIEERPLHLLIEAVTDYAIYMLDPTGCVTSWNPAAEKIKGYRRAEIEGQPFRRFFTKEDQAAGVPEQILERARRERKVVSEGWRVRKDGSRFWAHATVHAIRGEGGELIGYAKITRDMTDQRTAHEALLDSERRFRLLVESVVDYAIYMLDVNGVVTNWNRGAERIKGYKADEIVGRHFSEFYTPEDRRAGRPARMLETARRDGRVEGEGWRLRKDGTRFWALVVIDAIHDDDGVLIGFAKITRDITERRANQEALEQSERQFRRLIAGVVDYALFMLDPNGIVSSWNVGAEQIKGYTAEEIIGRHISTFYTEPERAAGIPARALQIAREQGRYEAEGWRVRKDGSMFWASVVIDAINEDGQLVGFAKITRDVTERRNAQLELQQAHERLAQAQKMEALGQLTGGVAHDFNNLLTVVSGQVEILRRRLGDDPRTKRSLEAIEMASRRGVDLTRHLLAFARRQRLRPTAISLLDRAGGLKELIGASLPSSVKLELDLPEKLWPIQADPSELELALLNLAVNARDAMPEGGKLFLTADNVTLEGGEVDPDLKGEFVAITVRDTGVGMPPDILARVFEPFFTTKPVDKGTGLGLSQVYGFARQSGGRVTITSEVGHGAAFTLYLPRSLSGPVALDEVVAVQGRAGAYVLVVEDNPEVAEVAAGLLEQLGYRTRIATGAQAALDLMETGERPDLVFSDIVMARQMDGLELARRVRNLYPETPVLLATGYSQAAERLGDAFPILAKPYQLPELSRAVSEVLATGALRSAPALS